NKNDKESEDISQPRRVHMRSEPCGHARILPCGQHIAHNQACDAKCLVKKTFGCRRYCRYQNDNDDGPICRVHCRVSWPTLLLNIQLASRQLLIRFEVLLAGLVCYLGRKRWRRWLLVPADLFEVIPDILLVVRVLCLPRLVLVGRPKSG